MNVSVVISLYLLGIFYQTTSQKFLFFSINTHYILLKTFLSSLALYLIIFLTQLPMIFCTCLEPDYCPPNIVLLFVLSCYREDTSRHIQLDLKRSIATEMIELTCEVLRVATNWRVRICLGEIVDGIWTAILRQMRVIVNQSA